MKTIQVGGPTVCKYNEISNCFLQVLKISDILEPPEVSQVKSTDQTARTIDFDALRQYFAWRASFPDDSLETIKNAQKMTLSLVSTPADADTTPVIQVEVTLPVKGAAPNYTSVVRPVGE